MYFYHIYSDNSYLKLAIQCLLTEMSFEHSSPDELNLKKILILSAKQCSHGEKTYNKLQEYDFIFCSELYYHACKQYSSQLKHKVINIDRCISDLKKEITHAFNYNIGNISNRAETIPSLSLNYNETIIVMDYIPELCQKQTKHFYLADIKKTSRYKRAIMARLGYQNTLELWLGVNFLFHLGCLELTGFSHDVLHKNETRQQSAKEKSILSSDFCM